MRLATVLLPVVIGAAACGSGSLPAVLPPTAAGLPMDAGGTPSDAECEGRVRADVDEALRMRTALLSRAVPATRDAATAAARDPMADWRTLGMPLRQDELARLRDEGIAVEGDLAISLRAHAEGTERYGGIWIDPPGGSRYVVSVVGGNQAWADLIQCVANGTDVSFVTAARSLGSQRSLQDRIFADRDALRALGVELTSAGYDETRNVVQIGVSSDLGSATTIIHQRYGTAVEVVHAEPPQAL